MKTIPTCRIGLFEVGLETYGSQFDGLKDHLIGYQFQNDLDFSIDVPTGVTPTLFFDRKTVQNMVF